jgi:hypothetical protein
MRYIYFNSGAAYVYNRDMDTGVWSQHSTLTVPFGPYCNVQLNCYNARVAINGYDGIAIGGSDHHIQNNTGAIWYYSNAGGAWTITQMIKQPEGYFGYEHDFGRHMTFQGDTLVVGDPNVARFSGSNTGVVHLYKRRPAGTGMWSCTGTLIPQTNTGQFGYSLSIDGDDVLIGARTGGPMSAAGMLLFFCANAVSSRKCCQFNIDSS